MLHAPFEPPVELVPIAPDVVVRRDSGQRLHADATGSLEATRGRTSRKLTRLVESTRHPLFELEAGRFDAAVAAWRERVKADPRTAQEDEGFANNLSYRILGRDTGRAIEVLRLVATVFPDSSNAHDSLGEAYMVAGDKPHAIAAYEQEIRTLDADPRVPVTARAARRSYAEQQLAKLRAP